MRNLVICENPTAVAVRAADAIVEIAREALETRGRFTLALCGGKTPEKTYSQLAQPDRSKAIDWPRTFVFFSDERFVPHGDSRSNYGLAQRALLSRVPIPAANVFPVPTGESNAASAAEAYSNTLTRFFQPSEPQNPEIESGVIRPRQSSLLIPRFDLILLGLGEDGHTASLFPGSAALDREDDWVTWSLPGTLPPPVDRITFTYPLLNAARKVLFLVSGEQKATVLKAVLEGNAAREIYPAVGVQPKEGRLTWLIDRSAAKNLPPCAFGQHAPAASIE
jgi:6-phosphogluconolactonase